MSTTATHSPCPFCGSAENLKPTELAATLSGEFSIVCNTCDTWGPAQPSEKHAWEAWEKRISQGVSQGNDQAVAPNSQLPIWPPATEGEESESDLVAQSTGQLDGLINLLGHSRKMLVDLRKNLASGAYALRPRNKHKTKQDVGTPLDFIQAIQNEFGPIAWDLASTPELAVTERFISPEQDTLTVDWSELEGMGPQGRFWGFLNPPFAQSKVFVAYASQMAKKGARIMVLVQASVDTAYFRDYVNGQAHVLLIEGRLTFRGHTDPFPKPLMLIVFNEAYKAEILQWNWRKPA